MGASYGKLDPLHVEAIYALKKAGKSGREIREALARGHDGLSPASISGSRANGIARRVMDERDELYRSDIKTMPAPEGLRVLTRRLMLIAEHETHRLERAERAGKLDATKLGKLAGAVTKLHTLLERNDAAQQGPGDGAVKKGDSEGEQPPSTFAAGLIDGATEAVAAGQASTAPASPAPIADRIVRAPVHPPLSHADA